MKRLLLIVLPLLLIVGCSSPEPINDETLIDKDGLKYHPDTEELYNGKVFINWDRWDRTEGSYKNGKQHGKWTMRDENGEKISEGSYKNGKSHGKQTNWYRNGQKEYEITHKNGKQNGKWTSWYENRKKSGENTWKDGKLISSRSWNEDGSIYRDN